jgi:hypothetical protein
MICSNRILRGIRWICEQQSNSTANFGSTPRSERCSAFFVASLLLLASLLTAGSEEAGSAGGASPTTSSIR